MRYEYDVQGRLVRWINLSAKTTTFFYENASFPHYLTRIVDPLGRNALRNVFNSEGRLIAQCDANGDISTLNGCSQFNPQPGTKTFTAINGRGFKTELVTDDRGNVLTERRFLDAINHLDTVRTYDANNNTLTERDPESNLRTFTYDPRGNRLSESDPGGRTTIYTYAAGCDKVETVRDPAGNITRNTYDDKCNLRFVQDALLKTTEYRYNSFGQRTQMIDPNGTTWNWNYLPNGLLQNVVDPFGKATTFSFDTKGNLLNRTDRNGRRIDFQYDASNRLTRETWDNGRISNYGYDDLGALLTASDPDSALTMTYDNLGHLRTVDNLGTPGAPRVVMTYSYDVNGNTTKVQDSLGGITDYSYDALDRLSRVTQSGSGVQSKRVDMSYSPASLLTQLKRFSDLTGTQGVANTNYEYECGGCPGRLAAIRHRKASDNSVIHDMTFMRDPLGNILSSTDAEGAHLYGYDPLRRLTSATHPVGGMQPSEFYTYDAVGNRLTSHLSHVYTYSWQTQGKGNRLLKDNQFDYVYDNEGNLTRKTDRTTGAYTEYVYNYRNRMTAAIQRNLAAVETGRMETGYDPLNKRNRAVQNGEVRYWVYDAKNPILELRASSTRTLRRLYTRGLDGVVAEELDSQTRWLVSDQVGSVRGLLDDHGSTLNRYAYDSFGRLVFQANNTSNTDLLFASREFSRSENNGFFRARHYNPSTGTFLQEDILRQRGYTYSVNNPLSFTDPTGRLELADYITLVLAVYSIDFLVTTYREPDTTPVEYLDDLVFDVAIGGRLACLFTAIAAAIDVWEGKFQERAWTYVEPGLRCIPLNLFAPKKK